MKEDMFITRFKVTELAKILGMTRQQIRNWITLGIEDENGEVFKLEAEEVTDIDGTVLRYYITLGSVDKFMKKYYKTTPLYKWGKYLKNE